MPSILASFRRLATPSLLAATLTLAAAVPADRVRADQSLPEPTEPTARLDALFSAAYAPDAPGAAVIVVRGDEVLLRAGYGMADLEMGVPVEPEMVFRIGSLTKQFTAAAVLMLVEEGRLDLDGRVSRYLEGYDGPAAAVTVHQLLTHTAGVPSYTDGAGDGRSERDDLTTGQVMESFRDRPLDFEPGTRWAYSNSGYFLLGVLIEEVSGTTYEEFVETRIFVPLGMSGSRYGHADELVPGRVEGYEGGVDGYRPARYLSMTQPYAAGSLLSTVDDLARWDAALRAGEILTEESRELLGAAATLPGGLSSGYGYGFWTTEYLGDLVLHHGGSIFGFTSYMFRVPDADIFVAVLSNNPSAQPGTGPLAMEAMAIAVGVPLDRRPSADLSAEELDHYTGVYAVGGSESDDVRIFVREGDRLVSILPGGRRVPVVFSAPDRFHHPQNLNFGRFERDEAGEIAGVRLAPMVGPQEWAVRTDRPIPEEEPIERD